jgi:hypothetical protein
MSAGAQQRRKHAKDQPHVTKDNALSPNKMETKAPEENVTKQKGRIRGCRRISAAIMVILMAIIWGLWNEVGPALYPKSF